MAHGESYSLILLFFFPLTTRTLNCHKVTWQDRTLPPLRPHSRAHHHLTPRRNHRDYLGGKAPGLYGETCAVPGALFGQGPSQPACKFPPSPSQNLRGFPQHPWCIRMPKPSVQLIRHTAGGSRRTFPNSLHVGYRMVCKYMLQQRSLSCKAPARAQRSMRATCH